MRGQAGFWDIDERYARLSEACDPLEKLNALVPWEVFRKPLGKALKRSDGAKGGRPPFDPVMMFKILVIQALYNLSDDRAEFLINDRLSFMRFLGLGLGRQGAGREDDLGVPRAADPGRGGRGAVRPLRPGDSARLATCRWRGQIVDASLVAAPKQRNTEAEKTDVKEGQIPDDWKEQPAKLRQKDRDARWTVKSSARPAARGRHPAAPTSRSRSSATSPTPASTGGTASSVDGTSPPPRPT